ncbi:hypothetical protein [Streptosporangium sp. NPDC002524]|uniref:hypothetical protein n=1 Tax=Streptosporangium sp. NPDC002524 TaxID=3154537 RepID=UPI0033175FCE
MTAAGRVEVAATAGAAIAPAFSVVAGAAIAPAFFVVAGPTAPAGRVARVP